MWIREYATGSSVMHYISKSECDAFIAAIDGTAVGHTPATPISWDPTQFWAAKTEYITKRGVVVIVRWGDLPTYSYLNELPIDAYIIYGTSDTAHKFAIAQPMVKRHVLDYQQREFIRPHRTIACEPMPPVQQTMLFEGESDHE